MHKANITFLINGNGATLELQDEESSIKVVKLELDADQLLRLLAREAKVDCNVEYGNLEKVGKKMLVDYIEFDMPKCTYKEQSGVAYEKALDKCPEGWIVDDYFRSRESFHWDKDGRYYAMATIRKWEDQCNQN